LRSATEPRNYRQLANGRWPVVLPAILIDAVHIDLADSRAAAGALVHDYSRRYIAASPHRMEQLLAAYRSSKEPQAEDDDIAEQS
jgi:hypothetical protein